MSSPNGSRSTRGWAAPWLSPRTGLLYAGVFNSCMDLTNHIVQYIPSAPYDGMEMQRHPGPGGNWGEFIAWMVGVEVGGFSGLSSRL